MRREMQASNSVNWRPRHAPSDARVANPFQGSDHVSFNLILGHPRDSTSRLFVGENTLRQFSPDWFSAARVEKSSGLPKEYKKNGVGGGCGSKFRLMNWQNCSHEWSRGCGLPKQNCIVTNSNIKGNYKVSLGYSFSMVSFPWIVFLFDIGIIFIALIEVVCRKPESTVIILVNFILHLLPLHNVFRAIWETGIELLSVMLRCRFLHLGRRQIGATSAARSRCRGSYFGRRTGHTRFTFLELFQYLTVSGLSRICWLVPSFLSDKFPVDLHSR